MFPLRQQEKTESESDMKVGLLCVASNDSHCFDGHAIEKINEICNL